MYSCFINAKFLFSVLQLVLFFEKHLVSMREKEKRARESVCERERKREREERGEGGKTHLLKGNVANVPRKCS